MNLPPVKTTRRGQPVVALCGLLACWTGVRVLAWTMSASAPVAAMLVSDAGYWPTKTAAIAPEKPVQPDATRRDEPSAALPVIWQTAPAAPALAAPDMAPSPVPYAMPMAPAPAAVESPAAAQPRPNPTLAGGHQLMFLAALSMMPLPPEFMPPLRRGPSPIAKTPRWSADGWVLLRREAGFSSLATSGGSYGASQIGAVLRYRLDRTSANKPSLYLRTSAALNGTREQEAAFGMSLRPVARLPLLAFGEARVSRSATGTQIRPAAFIVTELPPARLPLGVRGEAYVQAGYVGGKGASAFVDGQVRIDTKLFSLGKSEMRFGGGAWGGAQVGASRLDVGPSASLSFRLENTASARLSADWRFRVAGNAAPASGPALTLSAGF